MRRFAGIVFVTLFALAAAAPARARQQRARQQEDAGAGEAQPSAAAPAAPADAAAAEAWKTISSAMSVPGERAPVVAFELAAEVLTRQNAQTNEFRAAYRYLAPQFIRFELEGGRETGRGPGDSDKAFWLKDKGQVTELAGREFEADRSLVRRMTTIAQNVIAFADPARIRASGLVLRDGPPPLLPKSLEWEARRLTWLEFTSPDFDLYRAEPARPAEPAAKPAPRTFRVALGADPKTHWVRFVLLREELPAGAAGGEPLLFALQDYRPIDGYLLPHMIHVRWLDTAAVPPLFADKPSQEIYVTFADLTPKLAAQDFAPDASKH